MPPPETANEPMVAVPLRARLAPHRGKLRLLGLGFVVGALLALGYRRLLSEVTPAAAGLSGEQELHDAVSAGPSERVRALARLRTVPVRRRVEVAAEVRLLGQVVPSEKRLRAVTAWTGGRIDRLHVNTTGERVEAGQVVASLYSPEVVAAHQDLLVAARQQTRLSVAAGGTQEVAAMAEKAVSAARERLRLLGVPDDELTRMEKRGRPLKAVAIRSPFSGTVTERVATEGAYVATGAELYRIADLERVWVQLNASESELPRLSTGQAVAIHLEALPGEEFAGEITFIDPTLDATRRTALVRVEVGNRSGSLRPGMFAEATVAAGDGVTERSPLVVPAGAPVFTGRRAIVYVESEPADELSLAAPRYEARTVRLGPRLGQEYPVVAGLSEGERVVARGAFALDADLQIPDDTEALTRPVVHETARKGGAIELSAGELRPLSPVLEGYLDIQRSLAADQLSGAKTSAGQLEKEVGAVKLDTSRVHRDVRAAWRAWNDLAPVLIRHAQHVRRAGDLEAARAGFERLTEDVATLLTRFGNPLGRSVNLAFCPMAFGSEGASWFQLGAQIDNAFFGETMRSCGELRERIAPGGHLRSYVRHVANPR